MHCILQQVMIRLNLSRMVINEVTIIESSSSSFLAMNYDCRCIAPKLKCTYSSIILGIISVHQSLLVQVHCIFSIVLYPCFILFYTGYIPMFCAQLRVILFKPINFEIYSYPSVRKTITHMKTSPFAKTPTLLLNKKTLKHSRKISRIAMNFERSCHILAS